MRKIIALVFALGSVIPAPALDKDNARQRVLEASHSTRINDVDTKPWHMKVKFQLNDRDGQPAETGTIEEWWANLGRWKIKIESPSYSATVIENQNGDFRTQGAGPIPVPIRAIEQDIVYPMPMGEDLSKDVPHMSSFNLEKASLDCVQLTEPPIPVPSATFCFDPAGGTLRAIISAKSQMLVRNRIDQFAGHSPALSITISDGKVVMASAEVVDLSEMQPEDQLFAPSQDMKEVTDMHTLGIRLRAGGPGPGGVK